MKSVLIIGSIVMWSTFAMAQNLSIIDINGHKMVPLRHVMESCGARVNYDSDNRETGISLDKQKMKISENSRQAEVDGRTIIMDTTPVIIGGVSYIPVTAVSPDMGMNVKWIDNTQKLQIDYPLTGKIVTLEEEMHPLHHKDPVNCPDLKGPHPGQIGVGPEGDVPAPTVHHIGSNGKPVSPEHRMGKHRKMPLKHKNVTKVNSVKPMPPKHGDKPNNVKPIPKKHHVGKK